MKKILAVGLLISLGSYAVAEDKQEVDTTHIKANKELPQILYIVPWKDLQARKDTEEKLVLHDFFGDLYEPVLPNEIIEQEINPN